MKIKTVVPLALIVAFAAPSGAHATPQGLTASDWSNIQQQAYLKASNPQGGDEFGHSVSVSGDTVVLGAEWEDSSATGVNGNQSDNGATDSGAAYVFVRDGTNWTQ